MGTEEIPLYSPNSLRGRHFRRRVRVSETKGTHLGDEKLQRTTSVTEYAAWFKYGTGAPQDALQVSVLLDTNSERNIISQSSAFHTKIGSADKETDVMPLPFLGRGGEPCEAKTKILLTWRPEGPDKWIDTDFHIVEDDEPVAILGRDWVDFKCILHDIDFSVSPFRLPGIKSTRRR